MGSSRRDGAKNGCALYVRKSIQQGQLSFVADNSTKGDGVYDGNKLCELSMFSFRMNGKDYRVISVYNHPKNKFEDFYRDLKSFMSTHELDVERNREKGCKVFVIGDLNVDVRKLPLQDESSTQTQTLSK